MNKLNFGCGGRLANDWVNIDFHSANARVKRVNLLKGFGFPDQYFDVVYSSHVLEHFTRAQARFLLAEAYRVLKPGGILRIVVPNLEESCREYLRVLSLSDADPSKSRKYEWILIELLDQLVRTFPSGEMGAFEAKLRAANDQDLLAYVRSRTQNVPWFEPKRTSIVEKLRRVTPQNIAAKVSYWYLKAIGKLIPKHLRSMVLVQTQIGERHRWMYDSYGLRRLLEEAGLRECKTLAFNESAIPNFNDDFLDCNPDGSSYKNNSIYMEARRLAEGL